MGGEVVGKSKVGGHRQELGIEPGTSGFKAPGLTTGLWSPF